MKLTEAGEARIRGYLFILGRSLRSFLPQDIVADSLREIESHVRERVEQTDSSPNEATALERVLAELGPPLRVAQAYSAEMTVDEAVTTRGVGAISRALWHLATTTVRGFFTALGLSVGYTAGVACLIIAILKPIFPENVGIVYIDGMPRSFGALFPLPPGGEVRGGYWVIPIMLVVGPAILVFTHRCAHRFLTWWRSRNVSRIGRSVVPNGVS